MSGSWLYSAFRYSNEVLQACRKPCLEDQEKWHQEGKKGSTSHSLQSQLVCYLLGGRQLDLL